MEIIYTRNAVDDLDCLHQLIADHNPSAAKKAATRIINAVNRLIEFPSIGKKVSKQDQESPFRDLITGKYIIRYATIGTELHILRIWHGKEDLF